jgi:hypothetical protein
MKFLQLIKTIIKWGLIFGGVIFYIIIIMTTIGSMETRTIYLDCNMQWHPDFPIKAKEECRRIQSGQRV